MKLTNPYPLEPYDPIEDDWDPFEEEVEDETEE